MPPDDGVESVGVGLGVGAGPIDTTTFELRLAAGSDFVLTVKGAVAR